MTQDELTNKPDDDFRRESRRSLRSVAPTGRHIQWWAIFGTIFSAIAVPLAFFQITPIFAPVIKDYYFKTPAMNLLFETGDAAVFAAMVVVLLPIVVVSFFAGMLIQEQIHRFTAPSREKLRMQAHEENRQRKLLN